MNDSHHHHLVTRTDPRHGGRSRSFSSAVRSGELIALSAQNALTADGGCRGDMQAQARVIVERINGLLDELDTTFEDLVKLVVFYVSAPGYREAALRSLLAQLLDNKVQAVLTLVPVHHLGSPGLLLEVDAWAMRAANGRALERNWVVLPALGDPGATFCHGLRCGQFVFTGGQSSLSEEGKQLFPGDLVSQNRMVLDNLASVLQALGTSPGDIVKANSWRAAAPSYDAYAQAARERFMFFRGASPAVTGITVPGLVDVDCLIRIDLWAMQSTGTQALPRKHLQPAGHWGWKLETSYSHGLVCGDWLFVGGQAALDSACEVQHEGDLRAQTMTTMNFVRNVLREAGADCTDIVKLNTLYCAGSEAETWREVSETVGGFYTSSEPAYSAIAVDNLAYQGQLIEIEAVAFRCDALKPH